MIRMYYRSWNSPSTVVIHVNRWNWKRGIFESNPPARPIWGIELQRVLSAAFAFAYIELSARPWYTNTHKPPMHSASNCHTGNSERQRRVLRSHTAALLVCADQRPGVAIKYRLQTHAEYTSSLGSICDAANCHSRELLYDIALAAGKNVISLLQVRSTNKLPL